MIKKRIIQIIVLSSMTEEKIEELLVRLRLMRKEK
jgi:hypothetical protein